MEAANLYLIESQLDDNKKINIDNVRNIYDLITVKGEKTVGGALYINTNGKIALSVIIRDKCYKKEFDFIVVE